MKKRMVWTVARMLKVLAAGVKSRGGRTPNLEEVEERYGIGIRDILRLSRRLSSSEDLSPAGQLPLQLFFGYGQDDTLALGSQGAEPLLQLSRLSKADALLAAQALDSLAVDSEAKKLCASLASKLRKAAGSVIEDSRFLYKPSDPVAMLKKVALIRQGAAEQRTLAFEYRGPSSKSAGRVADPLSLRRDDGAWRVLAWDHQRQAMRTFALDHLAKIVITGNHFEWPKGTRPEEIKARDLSIYQPTGKEIEVKLRVSRRIAEEWKRSFKKIGKLGKAGTRDVTIMAASGEWMLRTFLPMVDEVRVLGPEKVMQLWKDEIKALISQVN